MSRLACLLIAAPLILVAAGCGGGGGPAPPGDQIPLGPAVNAPLPNDPGPGDPATVARLRRLQYPQYRPDTVAELQAELSWWVGAVQQDRNDSCGQLGLGLMTLTCASQNASHAVGEDIFARPSVSEVASIALRPGNSPRDLASQALGRALSSGAPRTRFATAPGADQASRRVGPGDLERYRQAIRTGLIPYLKSVEDRLFAIADGVPPDLLLFVINYDGELWAFYGADFRLIGASVVAVRGGLLTLVAVDPNYGDYNWGRDLRERDANHDGVLTVAEYAPPSPFGDINAPEWGAAGGCLRDVLRQLIRACDDRQPSPHEVINRVLDAVGRPRAVEAGLGDIQTMLAGPVEVTVEYDGASSEAPRCVAENVPVNLREIWDGPPASFRSLLAPKYLMLQYGSYEDSSGDSSLTMRLKDTERDRVEYKAITGDGGEALVEAALAPAPHQVPAPGAACVPALDLSFSWDWSQCTGTLNGNPFQGTPAEPPLLSGVSRWDEMPDPTFSGVFPDPEKLSWLLYTDFDHLVLSYGSIRIEP